MDEYFIAFEQWYKSKEKEWNSKGIYIDKSLLSSHAHQYHLDLSSKFGLGRINLYESNGYYWVDFEAGVYTLDDMFCIANISFNGEKSICNVAEEFIQYLQQK